MDTTTRYVTDLGSWDLLRTEALEDRLLKELRNFHTCSTTRALMRSRWTIVLLTRTERARDYFAPI